MGGRSILATPNTTDVCMFLLYGHPVWAGHPFSVAVLCENGLFHVWPGQIIAEQLIDDLAHIGKQVSAVDPFVVVGSG